MENVGSQMNIKLIKIEARWCHLVREPHYHKIFFLHIIC